MKSQDFSEVLNQISVGPLSVLNPSIPLSKYVLIDLSETNESLNIIDVSLSSRLETYINNHITTENGLVAYGGYLEVRNIYKCSSHFNSQSQTERNIHIGLDLWCATETAIYAPLDGVVHSFRNNQNYGDYGPTIILKHSIDNVEFYTLYGHLSLKSIEHLSVGQTFNKGDVIGTLGDAIVNGDYPPHLHFQIIRHMQGHEGDFPGVCNKTNLEFYKTNCPDPNLLLKL